MNAVEVMAKIRDLAVQLHRGNETQAEIIIQDVVHHLKAIMLSGADPGNDEMQRTQQTMFAMDEVRTLLTQNDLDGAAIAARDAAREWKQRSTLERTV